MEQNDAQSVSLLSHCLITVHILFDVVFNLVILVRWADQFNLWYVMLMEMLIFNTSNFVVQPTVQDKGTVTLGDNMCCLMILILVTMCNKQTISDNVKSPELS